MTPPDGFVRKAGHGIFHVEFNDIGGFLNQITGPQFQRIAEAFVFRGQSDAAWKLEPSLTRRLRHLPPQEGSRLTLRQLVTFMLAVRGRAYIRGDTATLLQVASASAHYKEFFDRLSPTQRSLVHEIWCLGQHHGLWTPCLDWTTSPFTALFFAVADQSVLASPSGTYVVHAINRPVIEEHCKSPACSSGAVVFLQPIITRNSRLDTQSGILTFCPNSVPLDNWIEDQFRGGPEVVLISFHLRGLDPGPTKRILDQMNINHRTLFPDLEGAARLCNQRLVF